MSALQSNINLFRNEVRTFSFYVLDALGNPYDLTGATFESDAKAQAGDVSVVASATFTIIDAAEGLVSFEWDGADFAAYGNVFAESFASYDLKMNNDVIIYGQIVVKPGVS